MIEMAWTSVVSLALCGAAAPDVPSLDEIYSHGVAQRKAINSLRVDYLYELRHLGDVAANAPLPGSWNIHFAMKGEMRKLDKRKEGDRGYAIDTYVFDGSETATIAYIHNKQGSRTDSVHIHPSKRKLADNDFYVTLALQIPVSDSDRAQIDDYIWFPWCLNRRLIDTLDAKGSKASVEEARLESRRCFLVHLPGYARFWIDPSIGYQCRRAEWYRGLGVAEVAYAKAEYMDFVESAPGVWLPTKFVRHDLKGGTARGEETVVTEKRIAVKSVTVNDVPDSEFRLKVPAGTLVSHHATRSFIRLDREVDDVIAESARIKAPAGTSTRYWRLAIPVCAAGFILGVWYLRRYLR